MPCKDCPDEKKLEGRPCDRIPDSDLCRIWEALKELNQASVHFQKHFELITCQRCREIAVDIQGILDVYSRMVSNAENYKREKARLTAQLQAIAEKFKPGAGKPEEDAQK